MSDKKQGKYTERGVYLLPNLFTTGGLFAGYYAIVAAMQARFEVAAIAIFLGMIMDGLDGRVARLTNTESEFGAQYDSMADIVTFGVAPSLVMYNWALSHLGKPGWLVAFCYTAATALRLARFNTHVGHQDKRYFQGLPCPAAAGLIAALIWVCFDYGVPGSKMCMVAGAVTLMTGGLMVSDVCFYSFKDIDLKGRVPFVSALVALLIGVLVLLNPPQVLLTAFSIYVLSGPVIQIKRWFAKKIKKRSST